MNGDGLIYPIAEGAGKWIEFHNERHEKLPVDALVADIRQTSSLRLTSQALTENSDLTLRKNVDRGEQEVA